MLINIKSPWKIINCHFCQSYNVIIIFIADMVKEVIALIVEKKLCSKLKKPLPLIPMSNDLYSIKGLCHNKKINAFLTIFK